MLTYAALEKFGPPNLYKEGVQTHTILSSAI